jgi:translation initiation factor IF-2
MGGEVLDVEVSALKGTNLDKLLDAILLQAELLELKANPDRTAEGIVIEAKLDKGRGSVATVLVQTGTLKPGDIVVAGDQWGRVRALVNDRGEQVKEAGPSFRSKFSASGHAAGRRPLAVVENEARAREIAEYRQRLAREKAAARQSGTRGSLEQMMTSCRTPAARSSRWWSRATCRAPSRPLPVRIEKLGTDEVKARIIHSGAGGITESDISWPRHRARDHRLQRACQQAGPRRGRARRHRDPLLQHHLRSGG